MAARSEPRPEREVARNRSTFALLTIAVGTGIVGLGFLLAEVAPPQPAGRPQQGTLLIGDLSLQIQDTGWITHDHIGGATPSAEKGFQMPAAMMAGLPDEGKQRLYLEAVLSNVGQAGASFGPEEFAVRSPAGVVYQLDRPASFASAELWPGQTRSLDLLFDVPDSVSTLQLVWSRDGLSTSIPIDSRPPAPHQHG